MAQILTCHDCGKQYVDCPFCEGPTGDCVQCSHGLCSDCFLEARRQRRGVCCMCRVPRLLDEDLPPATPDGLPIKVVWEEPSPRWIQPGDRFCPNGHPINDVNTMTQMDGYRYCRVCARERSARTRAELKEKGLTSRGTPYKEKKRK